MPDSVIRLGRLGTTEVGAHLTTLAVLGVLVAWGQTVAAGALLAALVVHEAGHWLAAHLVGLDIRRVVFWPLGGWADMPGLAQQDPAVQTFVLLAGPLANLAAAALWAAGGGMASAWLVRSQLAMGLGNLVPALPLDGGRALTAWAAALWGRKVAYRRAQASGRLLAGLLAAAALTAAVVAAGRGRHGREPWTALAAAAALAALTVQWTLARGAGEPAGETVAELAGLPQRLAALGGLPAGVLAAPGDASPQSLLGRLGPGRYWLVVVVDGAGRATGVVDPADLLAWVGAGCPPVRLADLVRGAR